MGPFCLRATTTTGSAIPPNGSSRSIGDAPSGLVSAIESAGSLRCAGGALEPIASADGVDDGLPQRSDLFGLLRARFRLPSSGSAQSWPTRTGSSSSDRAPEESSVAFPTDWRGVCCDARVPRVTVTMTWIAIATQIRFTTADGQAPSAQALTAKRPAPERLRLWKVRPVGLNAPRETQA